MVRKISQARRLPPTVNEDVNPPTTSTALERPALDSQDAPRPKSVKLEPIESQEVTSSLLSIPTTISTIINNPTSSLSLTGTCANHNLSQSTNCAILSDQLDLNSLISNAINQLRNQQSSGQPPPLQLQQQQSSASLLSPAAALPQQQTLSNVLNLNDILLPSNSSAANSQINLADLLSKLLSQNATAAATVPSSIMNNPSPNIIHIPSTNQQLISINGSNVLCNSTPLVNTNGGMQITIPLSSLIAAQDLNSFNNAAAAAAVLQPQLITTSSQQPIIALASAGVNMNIIGANNLPILPSLLNGVPMYLCSTTDNRSSLPQCSLSSTTTLTTTTPTTINSNSAILNHHHHHQHASDLSNNNNNGSTALVTLNGGGGIVINNNHIDSSTQNHSNHHHPHSQQHSKTAFLSPTSSLTTNSLVPTTTTPCHNSNDFKSATLPTNNTNALSTTNTSSTDQHQQQHDHIISSSSSSVNRILCPLASKEIDIHHPQQQHSNNNNSSTNYSFTGSGGGGGIVSGGHGGGGGNKLERKRARNRDAARKCRERKLSLIHKLENELKELQDNHRTLMTLFEGEKGNVDILRATIKQHKENGCLISLCHLPLSVTTTTATMASPMQNTTVAAEGEDDDDDDEEEDVVSCADDSFKDQNDVSTSE